GKAPKISALMKRLGCVRGEAGQHTQRNSHDTPVVAFRSTRPIGLDYEIRETITRDIIPEYFVGDMENAERETAPQHFQKIRRPFRGQMTGNNDAAILIMRIAPIDDFTCANVG